MGNSGLGILVATPNTVVRRQIREFVEKSGMLPLDAAGKAQALEIADGHRGELHVCLVEGQPEWALAILSGTRRRYPFMTGLVMTNHPESVMAEANGSAQLAFIEKPFSWRELSFRLAERVSASLQARHAMLMRDAAAICRDLLASGS